MTSVYHFEWRLRAPPAALWPYVSDTQRLNEALGLPEWKFEDETTPEGMKRTGSMRYLGLSIQWIENPFEWVEGKELGVERLYETGPIKRLRSHVRLVPDGAGTHLQHSLEFEPRGWIWIPVARFELGVKVRRSLARVYAEIDRFLAGEIETAYHRPPATLARDAGSRLADLKARLTVADACGEDLVRRLIDHVQKADDLALSRMRPFELADQWGADRSDLFRLFVRAARRGLLTLSWDVICPSCRGAKVRLADLSRLEREAHCGSCDVRIDTRAERAIELVFTVSPAIRRLDVRMHCIGGPGSTPHVVWQKRLAAGERVQLGAGLTSGTYRLRGPGVATPAYLRASPDVANGTRIGFRLAGPILAPLEATTPPLAELELANDDARERLLLLERAEWHDDAVTVGHAFSLQDFVELLPNQTAPAELGVTAGRLTVVAIKVDLSRVLLDLDPDERVVVARDLVLILTEEARARGGALGATELALPPGTTALLFVDSSEAVAAAASIVEQLKKFAAERELSLLEARAGADASPCVARAQGGLTVVSGDAVASAAALLELAQPGEIVLGSTLADDAAVEVAATGLPSERVDANVGGEPRSIVRLGVRRTKPATTRVSRSPAETVHDPVVVDDFELGEVIGRGGASIVHLARRRRDGRVFALKLQHAPELKARSRFERELRAYEKLQGVPGVVALHAHGTAGDKLWMALELIGGKSLAEILAEKGPYTVQEAAALLAPVGRALHAAHTRGVLHRDVKPSNIIVDQNGAAWLVDFGIAHFMGEDKSPGGVYSGTLRYLPPEAFEDPPVLDGRSDIYALGLTFFETAAGRGPFESAEGSELIVKIMSESSPSLHEVVRGAPESATAIARCALRKRPEDRYRTAADMALDLDLLARGQTPLHAPPLGEEGEGTRMFHNLLFKRAVEAIKRGGPANE